MFPVPGWIAGRLAQKHAKKQIAIEYGLPKGIKDWKVDFIWEAKYNKYVWHLFSTLKESQGDFGYRADGEQIVIDPNNASVIYQDRWQIK